MDRLAFTVGVISGARGTVVPAYSLPLTGGDTNA